MADLRKRIKPAGGRYRVIGKIPALTIIRKNRSQPWVLCGRGVHLTVPAFPCMSPRSKSGARNYGPLAKRLRAAADEIDGYPTFRVGNSVEQTRSQIALQG